MDPELLLEIAEKNTQDLVAIEQALGGLSGLLKLLPHFNAIYATVRAYEAKVQQPK